MGLGLYFPKGFMNRIVQYTLSRESGERKRNIPELKWAL